MWFSALTTPHLHNTIHCFVLFCCVLFCFLNHAWLLSFLEMEQSSQWIRVTPSLFYTKIHYKGYMKFNIQREFFTSKASARSSVVHGSCSSMQFNAHCDTYLWGREMLSPQHLASGGSLGSWRLARKQSTAESPLVRLFFAHCFATLWHWNGAKSQG